MLRRALLGVSRSEQIKNLVTRAPMTAHVVDRFVPGETIEEVVTATRTLIASGLLVSIDHLGEDTTERSHAHRVVTEYVSLLTRLSDVGLSTSTEVSVKLTALGQQLGDDGPEIALENAATICWAARRAGTMVTLDMEDHTTTDATLEALTVLRTEFPDTGAVLQSYLRRTEADCRDLAYPGSRVRLCKGAYAEPESVAFQDAHDVDLSYVRCLRALMAGRAYPMLATHDPTLIEIGRTMTRSQEWTAADFEFQMLYGIRPEEQKRLAGLGHRVRVYLPYGTDWYGYLIRRLAERPANLGFFARSLITKN
ncbi:MAG TPA: proline dehydrogenase family protein [Propionibacteriaceae bacterium]|nr:proline dehydrogenase family protein [Propionibacteriaceae bacterium]